MDKIDFRAFNKAYSSLDEGVTQAKTDLEKAGAIQRFEYSYELSWKFLKRVLAYRGISLNSPREVFRKAFQEQLIEDPKKWFKFLNYRNLTVHTYNENTAEEIFAILPEFKNEMYKLKKKFESLSL